MTRPSKSTAASLGSKSPTQSSRERWNQRYAGQDKGLKPPDQLLIDCYARLIEPNFPKPGAVLDLAGGSGRHALWMAQRGWESTVWDVSDEALAIARSQGTEHGVKVVTHRIDLEADPLPDARFDLILIFYYLQRELFSQLQALLQPEGMMLCKTYTTERGQSAGNIVNPDYLLHPGELRERFSDWTILHYSEAPAPAGTAEILARQRPA